MGRQLRQTTVRGCRCLNFDANRETSGKRTLQKCNFPRLVVNKICLAESKRRRNDRRTWSVSGSLVLSFFPFQSSLTTNRGDLKLCLFFANDLLGTIRYSLCQCHLCDFQIAFHQHGRHSKQPSTRLKSVFSGKICGHVLRIVQSNPKQILQRVLIFIAVHSTHHLATASAVTFVSRFLQFGLQPCRQTSELARRQLSLALRRHPTFIQLIEHLVPEARI